MVNELLRWSEMWDLKLNLAKTKVMVFRNKQAGSVSIQADGYQTEQVQEFKYLGVMLDSRLRFDVHAEYAAIKTRKAFGRISRLINGRQGVTVQCGLELYKALVRPHMEFSLPAWASMPESSIKLIEKVQGQSLRRILGTSAHSSSEAIEVVANVMPVRVRIEELCIREFMRMALQNDALNLRILLRSASVQHNQFTPMSYIKYVSKDFQAALDGDNSEDSNNENVVSQNSACDLAEDISSAMSIAVMGN